MIRNSARIRKVREMEPLWLGGPSPSHRAAPRSAACLPRRGAGRPDSVCHRHARRSQRGCRCWHPPAFLCAPCITRSLELEYFSRQCHRCCRILFAISCSASTHAFGICRVFNHRGRRGHLEAITDAFLVLFSVQQARQSLKTIPDNVTSVYI